MILEKINSLNEIILLHNDEIQLFLSEEIPYNILEEIIWGKEECEYMEQL